MSYYEAPWDRRPSDLLHRQFSWRMTKLDRHLPASMSIEGWHFRAWEPIRGAGDPYYLYAPDGKLMGRWETEPTLSDLYDCWREYRERS